MPESRDAGRADARGGGPAVVQNGRSVTPRLVLRLPNGTLGRVVRVMRVLRVLRWVVQGVVRRSTASAGAHPGHPAVAVPRLDRRAGRVRRGPRRRLPDRCRAGGLLPPRLDRDTVLHIHDGVCDQSAHRVVPDQIPETGAR